MKKLTIGLLALCLVSVWATAAQRPQPPAKGSSDLNTEKRPQKNIMKKKWLFGKRKNQPDACSEDINKIKNDFINFKDEYVKENNQIKIQHTELENELKTSNAAQEEHYKSLGEKLNKQKDLIKDLKSTVSKLEAILNEAEARFAETKAKSDSLDQQITKDKNDVATLKNELTTLQETSTSTNATVNKVADDAASKFLMIAIGFGIAVIFIGGLIFILRRRIDVSGVHMEKKIQSTKASLEEKALSLDIKLIELLEKQLLLSQEQKVVIATEQDAEPDHSLSLKVADEITRMQKNISQMDSSVKGIKSLTKGLERIRKNFMTNGYEIVDLLNKPFDDRMNIDVINMVDDPSLEKNAKVIVKVTRSQVNFNGVLIQRAQVDIAVN